ncbi:hypothetical protein STRCR_2187 [Streptococcus criceti HS-6]|uniref:Uncharacterized protein n=1 Tax=Streptococcus criceti HS-6 TaxID=873449 RepID=G5JSI7_STRCG|nr:hypothetical protein STRCR_2187 [Streptococcus criceti HS-6]
MGAGLVNGRSEVFAMTVLLIDNAESGRLYRNFEYLGFLS